jgi:hypothetical protein
MHDIDDRLTAAARSAAERAGLPDAPAIRDHGRRIVRRRRAARATGAVTLAAALVAGIGFAGGFGIGGSEPVAPASAPVPVRGGDPDTSMATIQMPNPTATAKRGSIELQGGSGGQAWTYGIKPSKEGVCLGWELSSGLGSGTTCGPAEKILAEDPDTAMAECVGGVANNDGRDQEEGKGNYATMITGVVSPKAALVRAELLDGRALEFRPVVSEELKVGLIAGFVPECVIHTWTIVYDPGGQVLAAKPMRDGTRTDVGNLFPITPSDPKGTITFAPGTTAERRSEILRAAEVRGAQLSRRDGDRYDFAVQLQSHRDSIRAQLEAAKLAGDIASFTLTRGTQDQGP